MKKGDILIAKRDVSTILGVELFKRNKEYKIHEVTHLYVQFENVPTLFDAKKEVFGENYIWDTFYTKNELRIMKMKTII